MAAQRSKTEEWTLDIRGLPLGGTKRTPSHFITSKMYVRHGDYKNRITVHVKNNKVTITVRKGNYTRSYHVKVSWEGEK